MSYKGLIIGLGSIAQKHIEAIKNLDPSAVLLALRSESNAQTQAGVENIYDYDAIPSDIDFVIISNPTGKHFDTLERLLAHSIKCPLFIEKPPFQDLKGTEKLLAKIKDQGIKTYTAYNFRFHPTIQWLKNNIADKRLLEANAYAGSYLPDWRPDQDYRQVYSATKAMGGGVHLDLIHEIDYMKWLLGVPKELHPHCSKISDLKIDSVDCAHYWLHYADYNASITLNYYRPVPKREVELVFNDDVWNADLFTGNIMNYQGQVMSNEAFDVQQTYNDQMAYFLSHLRDDIEYDNNIFEALETLKIALADY